MLSFPSAHSQPGGGCSPAGPMAMGTGEGPESSRQGMEIGFTPSLEGCGPPMAQRVLR